MLAVAALFTGAHRARVRPVSRAARRAERDSPRCGTAAAPAADASSALRAVLVTVEVTMSVILLITSGLLIRAVWRVQAIDPGFVAENVLTLQDRIAAAEVRQPGAPRRVLRSRADRVRALPGVQSAAFISGLPMVVTGLITGVEIPGQEARSARSGGVSHRWVTPQYFKTMGIPLLRGRDVEDGDTADRAWVAVVSESFGERYWPGQDPIGKTFGHRDRPRTVVGVVGDVKVRGLERTSEPQMYLPAPQMPTEIPANFDPKDLVIRMRVSVTRSCPPSARSSAPPIPSSRSPTCARMDDVLAGDTATRRAQTPGARRVRRRRAAALRRRHLRPAGLHRRRSDRRRSACASRWARSRRASAG